MVRSNNIGRFDTFCWRFALMSSPTLTFIESSVNCLSIWLHKSAFIASWLSSSLTFSCWFLQNWSLFFDWDSKAWKFSSNFRKPSSFALDSCFNLSSFKRSSRKDNDKKFVISKINFLLMQMGYWYIPKSPQDACKSIRVYVTKGVNRGINKCRS